MSLKLSYNGTPANEIKAFLEEKFLQYNNPSFIDCDPISIPHRYSEPLDREISGFLAAAIAWGRRDLILRSSRLMLKLFFGQISLITRGYNLMEAVKNND